MNADSNEAAFAARHGADAIKARFFYVFQRLFPVYTEPNGT